MIADLFFHPAARSALPIVLLAAALGCGGSAQMAPTAPTATGATIVVAMTGGAPLLIGGTAQMEARRRMPDGTSRAMPTASWRSDAPQVAAVSGSGVVSGVAAGEATITAELDTAGRLTVRVLPDFDGAWTGSEAIAACADAGVFAGACGELAALGQTGVTHGRFVQRGATVDAVIDLGESASATTTGEITVAGELQLPTVRAASSDASLQIEMQHWRSRSDVPSVLTGTYDLVFTTPGAAGSVRLGIRLQDVRRTTASAPVAAGVRSRLETSLRERQSGVHRRQP